MTETKTRRRVTSFRFNSRSEMVRAFQRFGIGIRTQKQEYQFSWRDESDLDYRERRILEKLGQKVTEHVVYSMGFRWGAQDDIKETFELPKDTHIEFWNWGIEFTTFNLTQAEHKRQMQKMYLPMTSMGFVIAHDCETMIVNNNCV